MKTPGQVAYETYKSNCRSFKPWEDLKEADQRQWERSAVVVLQTHWEEQ